jgi:hypothetical protein
MAQIREVKMKNGSVPYRAVVAVPGTKPAA